MRFIIPVNEAEVGESVTYKIVDVGDVTPRVAKRKLRKVFEVWRIPVNQHKRLLKSFDWSTQ